MLMASSLIFSVATVRVWSGRRLGALTWAACLAVVAGIGAFVALTSPGLSGGHHMPQHAGLAAIVLAIGAAPFAATGLAAAGRRRAILLAVGAGLADAAIAVTTMAFTHALGHGLGGVLTSWATYVLMIGGPCSLLLTQTAYQAGRPMITLPVVTVVTPMASLAVGVGLLGETTRLSTAGAVVVAGAVLLTAAGLTVLARRAAHQDPAAVGPAGRTGSRPARSRAPAGPAVPGRSVRAGRREHQLLDRPRGTARGGAARGRGGAPVTGRLPVTAGQWRTAGAGRGRQPAGDRLRVGPFHPAP